MILPSHDIRRRFCAIVHAAGELVMDRYQARDFTTRRKIIEGHEREELLTDADLASENFIMAALARQMPSVPVYAEERVDHGHTIVPDVLPTRYVLVDGLDGTAEFTGGTGYFGVHIALIEDGRPVVAAVSLPALGRVYSAVAHQDGVFMNGSFAKGEMGGEQPADFNLWRGPNAIDVRFNAGWTTRDDLMASDAMRAFQQVADKVKRTVTVTPRGDAHEFLALLTGPADLHIWTSRGAMWDVAPWDLFLQKTGGGIYMPDGRPLDYSQRSYCADKPLRVPPLVFMADRGVHALYFSHLRPRPV